jgi:hypothetical protein
MRNPIGWWLGRNEPKLKPDELLIWFDFQSNISAPELATIVSSVELSHGKHTGITITKEGWEKMHPHVKRHFSLEKPK